MNKHYLCSETTREQTSKLEIIYQPISTWTELDKENFESILWSVKAKNVGDALASARLFNEG